MFKQNKIYLASNSPRRKQILQQMGFDVHCVAVDIDETVRQQEEAEHYVLRMAKEKNQAAFAQFAKLPDAPLISADTSVVLGERILGKPRDAQEAACILRALSGNIHHVLTAVYVDYRQQTQHFCQRSAVHFANLSEAEIAQYIATGEPLDKAGAYGIQGFGGMFVRHLSGSFSGVMGLPVYETAHAIRQLWVESNNEDR